MPWSYDHTNMALYYNEMNYSCWLHTALYSMNNKIEDLISKYSIQSLFFLTCYSIYRPFCLNRDNWFSLSSQPQSRIIGALLKGSPITHAVAQCQQPVITSLRGLRNGRALIGNETPFNRGGWHIADSKLGQRQWRWPSFESAMCQR